MNFLAVDDASDEQLSDLGVVQKGDVLSLRGFVKEKMRGESRDEKKRKLLDLIKERVKPKKKKVEEKTSTEPGFSTDSLRRIQLGWLHYDPNRKGMLEFALQKEVVLKL